MAISTRQDYRQSLGEVYWKIGHLTHWENYKEGWKVLKQRQTPCNLLGYKILIGSNGFFALVFAGTASMFSGYAYLQGKEDLKSGENPFVSGHVSEWSMLALFTLWSYFKTSHAISILGDQENARKIFYKFFQQENSLEKRAIIYEKFLDNFNQYSHSNFLPFPLFPKLFDELSGDLPSKLQLDYYLSHSFKNIEHQISSTSRSSHIKKGWKIIKSDKRSHRKIFLTTATIVGGIFFAWNLYNYSQAIYYAAQQSYDDYQEGINPNVGGHSIEWLGESFVIMSIIYYYSNEIANVGRVKTIVDIFEKEKNNIELSCPLFRKQAKKRLGKHIENYIQRLPRGYIFSTPCWLMFSSEENDPELDEYLTKIPNHKLLDECSCKRKKPE